MGTASILLRLLLEISEVAKELSREVRSFVLDLPAVAHGAIRAGLQDLLHPPRLADAVVDAGQTILGSEIEEVRELVLNLRP